MHTTETNYRSGYVVAFAVLSWLGLTIHNAVELPRLTILSPEAGIPTLVYIVLVIGWWRFPNQRLWEIMLFVWALLHLVGGGITTVIPFSFLPFYPEQSLKHYLTHVLYSVTQLPLMVVLFRQRPQP